MLTKTIIRADNGREQKQTIVDYEEGLKLIGILEKKNIPYFAMHFDENGVASSGEGYGTPWCNEIAWNFKGPLPRLKQFM